MLFGLGAQPRVMRAVEGDDCSAAGFQPFEYLALRVGDGFLAAEKFHVRGRDGGHDGDMGAHHPCQRRQLARMVHPHFEDAEIGGRGHARQAQGDADMIVVAFDRTVRLAGAKAVERREQRLLGPRLARRAGDADDPPVAARARRGAERV